MLAVLIARLDVRGGRHGAKTRSRALASRSARYWLLMAQAGADDVVGGGVHPLRQPQQIVLADTVLQRVRQLPYLDSAAAQFF
jgi:hypothetical protein